MYHLPFEVIFTSTDGTESVLVDWKAQTKQGYIYYETTLGDMWFSILVHKEGKWYLKSKNTGKTPVTGFLGVRFPWKHQENGYTLIPGVYYDGNKKECMYPIPHISMPEEPEFEVSLSAATFPTVLIKDGDQGWHYDFSATSAAGWNGVVLNAQQETMTLYAPAREEPWYWWRENRYDAARPAYIWQPRAVVTLRFGRTAFPCEEITDLFSYHWEHAIRSDIYQAYNKPRLEEDTIAAYVRDWMYEKHCVITDNDEPILMNAVIDLEGQWPYNGMAEWNTMIGWCSGTMTALPLLKYGGKYRDFAVRYVDFLATHGESPSGVKYAVYDGTQWTTREHPEYDAGTGYRHCRFYSDYLHYLGKCIRLEKANGITHPEWEKDFAHGIDLLLDLWEREHDFGLYWNLESKPVTLERRGTCAGSFTVLALVEAVRHFPEDERLKTCFVEAARTYYERGVLTGHCNAGPNDIKESDDSESITALTDALVQQYQFFGGEENKKMALQAAQLFATWVLNYVPPVPGGSMLEGINVCGGVIANVQNRHIGPGICTNSARFLYDLGEITGDGRWTDLYNRVKAAALNCACTYDGEFFGDEYHHMFYQGMITEQINVTDAFMAAGEMWCVSASWPSTAVLLGWYDRPE